MLVQLFFDVTSVQTPAYYGNVRAKALDNQPERGLPCFFGHGKNHYE